MILTSLKNQQIKHIKQLQAKSKLRVKDHSFVIEGLREVSMALKYNFKITKVFVCKDYYKGCIEFSNDTEIIEVSKTVYEHLAYRSSTEGILAMAGSPLNSLKDLRIKNKNPLILVLESPEKPGNIGAILRTADAAQVDAIIIANPKTDLYNPNTIRSSLGAIFSKPIITAKSEEVYQYLTTEGYNLFAATLQNSNSYMKENYQNATALIMGSEANGLSEFWRTQNKIKAINIPMLGEIDSLNLSVSTAILTFEVLRQRNTA